MAPPAKITQVRHGFTYVELLAVIALTLVVIIMVACWTFQTRHSYSGVHCSSNLRQIGQAILLYSNDNKLAYPRTVYVGGTNQLIPDCHGYGTLTATDPFSQSPQINNVPAALFLLLRTEDITSAVFTCPSSNTMADIYGGGGNTALHRTNWTNIQNNLSYSYQNPYPDNGAIAAGFKLVQGLDPHFVIAADLNPGTSGSINNVNGVNLLTLTPSSPPAQLRLGNSNNHGKDGQNVLYADGHIEFANNVFVGIGRDNIFTRNAITKGVAQYGPNNCAVLRFAISGQRQHSAADGGESMRRERSPT